MDDFLSHVSLKPAEPVEQPASPFYTPSAPLSSDRLIHNLSPLVNISLTPQEQEVVRNFQETRLILGPAASAVMMCDIPTCPRLVRCPLYAMGKAPQGSDCPLELHQAKERFLAWCRELKVNPMELAESERVAVTQLCSIDIQEQRCLDILSSGDNTKLTQKSVSDVDTETGAPICFEHVIHQNQQLLDLLQARRRNILRDWALTPEAKAKLNKGITQKSTDRSNTAADTRDRLMQTLRDKK